MAIQMTTVAKKSVETTPRRRQGGPPVVSDQKADHGPSSLVLLQRVSLFDEFRARAERQVAGCWLGIWPARPRVDTCPPSLRRVVAEARTIAGKRRER